MEKLQAKCTAIVQADNRGQVTLTIFDKNKKPETQVTLLYSDPKKASQFEQGATYSVTVDKGK